MGRVLHTCNPSTWEAETGGFRVQGQPWLHSKTLSQKKKINKTRYGGAFCNPSTQETEAEGF
jgi:hypothetical protein